MDAIFVRTAPATKIKATLITKGGLGNIVVKHVYLHEHYRSNYAQYNSAVFVKYTEKGKRKPHGFVQTYRPYLVILEGWQDIASQSMWGETTTNANGTKISEGKYASFDPRWATDFEAATKFENVIADYRDVNTMEAIAA